MKATFQLSVLTDPSVPVVLFNVPLAQNASTDPGTGLTKWEFGSTPVMSSYIVAFALGEPLPHLCVLGANQRVLHRDCASAALHIGIVAFERMSVTSRMRDTHSKPYTGTMGHPSRWGHCIVTLSLREGLSLVINLTSSEKQSVSSAGNLTGISRAVPSSRSQHDINVTLWTTPDRVQNFDWALQSAAAILPNYEALFDYAYFLPKLDILALPGYLFQAMENWVCLLRQSLSLCLR